MQECINNGKGLPEFNWTLSELPVKGKFDGTEVFLDKYTKEDGTTGQRLCKSLTLPNVRRFKITQLGEMHPVFKAFGRRKRSAHPTVDKAYYTNKRLNRYLEHQLIRLNAYRNDSQKFWRTGLTLLLNSKIYTIVNYHATFPH
jgi:hypothetical protein